LQEDRVYLGLTFAKEMLLFIFIKKDGGEINKKERAM